MANIFNAKLRNTLVDFKGLFHEFVDEKEYQATIDSIDATPDTRTYIRLFEQHAANKVTEDAVFKCDPAILKSCAFFKRFDLKRVYKRMANKEEMWSRLCDLYRAHSMLSMLNDKMQGMLHQMAPSFAKSGLTQADVQRDPSKLMDVVADAIGAPGGTDMVVDMMTNNSGPMMECLGKLFRKPGQERSPVDEITERCDMKLDDLAEHSDQLKEVLANPLINNNLRDLMSTLKINANHDNIDCDVNTNDLMSKVGALAAKTEKDLMEKKLEKEMRDKAVDEALLDLERSEEAVKAFKSTTI